MVGVEEAEPPNQNAPPNAIYGPTKRLGSDTERPLGRESARVNLAEPAVCRQTPEVGAVCGNPACTDLCGARSVMGVSTANLQATRSTGTRLPGSAPSRINRPLESDTA